MCLWEVGGVSLVPPTPRCAVPPRGGGDGRPEPAGAEKRHPSPPPPPPRPRTAASKQTVTKMVQR